MIRCDLAHRQVSHRAWPANARDVWGRPLASAREVRSQFVKRLRAFLDRLPGGHRPPTGPLTTEEATGAEELRQETQAKEKERTEHEQDAAGGGPDREVPPHPPTV